MRVEAAKDPELLDLMARSGCFVVFVGLESINPATLKAYNKSQTVQGIKDCVINFHQFGIKVHGMFVFGSEEDHYQVIRDTVKILPGQLDLDSLQYLILTPVPGTPVYAELEKPRTASSAGTGASTTATTRCFSRASSRPMNSRWKPSGP